MTDQATPAEVRLTDGLGPLVERLRAYPADPLLCDDYSSAMLEAADEIERLRECLQWLQERHRGGLMRAKIDEALGAKLRAEWSKPGGLMQGPFA